MTLKILDRIEKSRKILSSLNDTNLVLELEDMDLEIPLN